jgi:hypothetical protein
MIASNLTPVVRRMAPVLALLVLVATVPQASAQAPAAAAAAPAAGIVQPGTSTDARWYLQTSVYTKHFRPDPKHDNHQNLVNLEYWRADNYLAGGAWFHNSFGQASQYLYVGRRWEPFENPAIYMKLTGGVLHGYKGEYRDKIPFNHSGYAPAIVPSVGYATKRFAGELVLFGTSGLMLTVGVFLN